MGGALSPAVAASRLAVREHLRTLSGSTVVVAVSGGADSLALLAAAAFEAAGAAVSLVTVTVDHALQQGSAEQAKRVAVQSETLGVACRVVTGDVGRDGGPEAAARSARYAALDAAAADAGAAAVLLGHTLDDQAETVLLGLARGSGARSIAGMRPVTGIYRRPFLRLRRATLVEACTAQGLEPWDDPMNADSALTRVRVRLDALPALEAAIGPGVAEALARTAEALRDDADALDAWAQQAHAAVADDDGSLDVASLEALPRAVLTRLLHRAAVLAGVPRGSLSAVHVREMERLVREWHGQGPVDLPGRFVATRACGRLHVTPRQHPSRPS